MTCKHPPNRLYAWNIKEDWLESLPPKERYKKSLVIVCLDCQEILKSPALPPEEEK